MRLFLFVLVAGGGRSPVTVGSVAVGGRVGAVRASGAH